jgi:pimeloyl-ACP methyl ester carboxylesterase
LKWVILVGTAICMFVAILVWLWTPDKDEKELRALYAKPPSEFRSVAGIQLHIRDTGAKTSPALVLLHGFGSSLHTWDTWASVLERDYRVIRIDLPGSGFTGADPAGDYSDERAMIVLNGLLEALNITQASMIGNSMGGRLAWKFSAKYPNIVQKLVLIAPDGFESPGVAYGKPAVVPAALNLMRFALPKALLRMNLEPAYANPSALTPEMLTRYHDMMLVAGARDAMLDRMRQVVLVNPVPILKTIRAPTLVLWGDKDAMIPLSNAKDYQAALPSSQLVVLPNIGHVPHEEAPGAALLPVITFLK